MNKTKDNNFCINFLYELYKDKTIGNKEKFKEETKEYNLSREQIRELYTKIKKYQINKYGQMLEGDYIEEVDCKKVLNNKRSREKWSRKTRGINKNAKLERWTTYE